MSYYSTLRHAGVKTGGRKVILGGPTERPPKSREQGVSPARVPPMAYEW